MSKTKKIVLIGDSIRMGYDKYVKEALADVAEVYYPEENCKFAEYVLRFAHEWKNNEKWPTDVDLVHWNAGLWDALELFGDVPLTSISYYKEAIARIDKRLRMLFPKAKIVFATSTAVLEDLCSPDFRRHNSTIMEYNEAALEALKSTDTVINDLWPISYSCPREYHSDFVHYYTPEGTDMMGKRVLSVICGELDISAEDVKLEDFVPETYSKSNIGY